MCSALLHSCERFASSILEDPFVVSNKATVGTAIIVKCITNAIIIMQLSKSREVMFSMVLFRDCIQDNITKTKKLRSSTLS